MVFALMLVIYSTVIALLVLEFVFAWMKKHSKRITADAQRASSAVPAWAQMEAAPVTLVRPVSKFKFDNYTTIYS